MTRAVEWLKTKAAPVLAVANLGLLGLGHLALTDLHHGTGGTAEWTVLRLLFVTSAVFSGVVLAGAYRKRGR